MSTTPTFLKPYKIQELVFSCLRSKLAYESPKKISNVFKRNGDRDILNTSLVKSQVKIREKVDVMIDKIYTEMNGSEPVFYDGSQTEKKKDAQGYILWKNNTIYLSFRGTKEFNDIKDVIDTRPRSVFENSTYVHSGFAEQFMSVEENITNDIKYIISEYPIERIVFSGHSMGGALATIAAVTYGKMFRDLHITCHTLGTPLVGDSKFKSLFETYIDDGVRLDVEEDIIPKLPVNKSFVHLSNGILLREDGIAEYITEPHTYKSYTDFFFHLIKNEEIQKITKYHSCEMYIERLLSLEHLQDL